MDAALATLLFFVLLAVGAALGGVDTRRSGGWTRADIWDAGRSATPDRPASRLRSIAGATRSRLLSWRRVRWPQPLWALDTASQHGGGTQDSPDSRDSRDSALASLPQARAADASGASRLSAGSPDGATVRH
jgi:hypothetical protein